MKLKRIAPDIKKEMKNSGFAKVFNEERLKLELAHQLAEIRHERHLSQTEVAKRMGVKPQIISRIEKGGLNLTIATMSRYAKSVGSELTISFKGRRSHSRPHVFHAV